MRAVLVFVVVLFAAHVASAPARVERLPLGHAELHDLEAQAREAHPHTSLTARDFHPLTPVLLAHLDQVTPAFIVEREVAAAMLETDQDSDMDVSAEPNIDDMDDQAQTTDVQDEEDDALIESDFEISAPYGGYGGFGGYSGYGKKGGYGGYGGYGSKKVPFKKVPYKKVPYKKVPFKKAPPKKKLPPKKFPPKKKGGFGFGGYGGFKKGFGGYGGFGGGHH